jgi:hypothetical protein
MAEAYWIVTYQTEDDPKVLGRIREAGGTGDIVGVTSFAACRRKFLKPGWPSARPSSSLTASRPRSRAYESPDDFPACGISSTTTAAAPNGNTRGPHQYRL